MRVILTLLVFFLSSIPILSDGVFTSTTLDILFLVIAGISSIALFSYSDRSYSLYKVFYIFVLFFFCIAPAIQFKNGVSLLFTKFAESDYVITTLYILLSIILYSFFYFIFNKKIRVSNSKSTKIEEIKIKPLKLRKEILPLLISSCIFLIYLYINKFNLASLLFRGGELADRIPISQISFLILSYFLRPMTMILFLSICITKVTHKIVPLLLFILFVLTAPPTGMARFAAAAMYIPVVMWFIPILRKKNMFVLVLILSLLIVFPFLGNFRHYSGMQNIKIGLDFEQFETLNFDSFSMFMRVLKDDVITHGNQLLGVILFWLPRSIWPSKPIGSGAYIAEKSDLIFSNISMPYIGEGYINFGLLGMVLFVILIAYITARLDKEYWSYVVYKDKSLDKIRYFLLLGLLFFVLRGDMLSSFAYTCGFMLSFKFVKKII